MDLIDLLHVNNDIMSYSLAFASLAYSVGGLLSGFLFNYVNRQVLIAGYLLIFGLSNIATPFISNYLLFSVITVFKMMCAGGTDCGTNVWILEMWPGKDSWLQALHFSFAVGCALGPLIVEPFLSNDLAYKENEIDKIAGKTSGATTINDQNNETRIHIPYGVSGMTSILASSMILYLYYLDLRHKRRLVAAAAQPEQIPLQQQQPHVQIQLPEQGVSGDAADQRKGTPAIEEEPEEEAKEAELEEAEQVQQQQQQQERQPDNQRQQQQQQNEVATLAIAQQQQQQQQQVIVATTTQINPKITSKAKEQLVGRPPYYVMFAIALAAMCLSFYCGIEITSMNYLATFAVNIDLQLPKSTAALMSSALTISFAVGRGFGIWIAAYMRPHKLFYLCSGIMASGNVLMLIFANTAEMLLWYSICIFGIGCGPMFPAIVSFYDDKISKVTNTVSGIFILGSMFNVALNSLIIGHHIIDNALILIVCNLIGSVLLLVLFGTLHMLTKVKKNQRLRKYKLKQQAQTNKQQPPIPLQQLQLQQQSDVDVDADAAAAAGATQTLLAAAPTNQQAATVVLEIDDSPATITRPQ